jgi:DNA-directed RNA polymerase subunit beta'
VLEYFNSTHGARKGLADTALKTADAGYLTRKLCDVAMDMIIAADDDGNPRRRVEERHLRGRRRSGVLKDRIVGRCSSDDIHNPLNPDEIIVKNGSSSPSPWPAASTSWASSASRSCPADAQRQGRLPSRAYGINPATNEVVEVGTAVGIIAAQSIGDPARSSRCVPSTSAASQARWPRITTSRPVTRAPCATRACASSRSGPRASRSASSSTRRVSLYIVDDNDRELEVYKIPAGAVLMLPDGGHVAKGQVLAQWDPHNVPIISERGGSIGFRDMIPGVTVKRELDPATGRIATTVVEHKEDLNPSIEIVQDTGKVLATYPIPTGAQLQVNEGDIIPPGAQLAKTPDPASKTQDITGGHPRVAELFEARRPRKLRNGQGGR